MSKDDDFEEEATGAGDQAFPAHATNQKTKAKSQERSKSPGVKQSLQPFGRGAKICDDRETFLEKEKAKKAKEEARQAQIEQDRFHTLQMLKSEGDPDFARKKKDA